MCFKSRIIPRQWNHIIIRSIPKKGKDYKVPQNTRGINLIITIAKLYNPNVIVMKKKKHMFTLLTSLMHLTLLTTPL